MGSRAVLVSVFTAGVSATAPIQKVLDMMITMKDKVLAEGNKEAELYDKFSCFCKDTSADKTRMVNDGTAKVSALEDKIDEIKMKIEGLNSRLEKENILLTGTKVDMAMETSNWAKTKEEYDVNMADMMGAVSALEEAIGVLKASMSSGAGEESALLSVKNTVTTALEMASALGLHSKKNAALLQVLEAPTAERQQYGFHSGGIIETLEGLEQDFKLKRDQLNTDHADSKHEHTVAMQEYQHAKDSHEAQIKSLTEEKQAKHALFGEKTKGFTVAKATLTDDQTYLSDLTSKCNAKKSQFDQRKMMRAAELHAVQTAASVIEQEVATKTFGAERGRGVSLLQKRAIRKHRSSSSRKVVRRAVHRRGTSFLATAEPRNATAEPRNDLFNLLSEKADLTSSSELRALASMAKKDPLAKVKKLIQELVLRLQQEASDEETHHGWCTKQTALAEQNRDDKVATIKAENKKMAQDEATREELKDTIAALTKEKTALETALQEASDVRDAEHAENNQVVSDANEGLSALEMATEILTTFYKETAVSLVTQKDTSSQVPASDLPDTGFGTEYQGDQETATGIFGMLEVINGDFKRTIAETNELEATQAADFLDFKRTSNGSMAEKDQGLSASDAELKEILAALAESKENLGNAIASRDSALKELIDLYAACEATGQSFEERTSAREEETAALREALEIFENWRNF